MVCSFVDFYILSLAFEMRKLMEDFNNTNNMVVMLVMVMLFGIHFTNTAMFVVVVFPWIASAI